MGPASSVALSETALEPEVLDHAVLKTVAYADVFDYAIGADEVHRFLHGVRVDRGATSEALSRCSAPGGLLSAHSGYYTLRGRAHADVRRERSAVAERLWPIARWYGGLLAQLPFVRMVAVSGSLAWNNAGRGGDIDYFVVTEPGRLWVSRWLTALLRRLVPRKGIKVCVNYVVSERALVIPEQNIYTACEMARLTPLTGYEVYRRLWAANSWVQDFLPNVPEIAPDLQLADPPAPPRLGRVIGGLMAGLESILRSRAGAAFERAEMWYRTRKMAREARRHGFADVAFSADVFKGHANRHQANILAAFAERLERLGLAQ